MSWIDRVKGPGAGKQDDAMPDFSAEAEPSTLAEAAKRNHAARHPGQVTSADLEEDVDDGLPSVNRRKTGNKTLTYLGYAAIVIFGLAAVWAVNGPKGPPKKKPNEDQLANAMPRLELPKPVAPPVARAAPSAPTPTAAVPVTPQQGAEKQAPQWWDRKMGAAVMAGGTTSGGDNPKGDKPAGGPGRLTTVSAANDDSLTGPKNDLAVKLEPTTTKAVSASMLPNRNFLLTKGSALDCALETAIDSTLPGMTTCRLTRDVYSDNSQVVLLDRGTQLVGEYVGGLKNGQARLFVLWTRAKTPKGVVVALNSPGTDALGRSGHEGFVDNHWMERFGAAILMSVVKDTMAAVLSNQSQRQDVRSSSNGAASGNVIYSGGANSNPYANTMTGGEQIITRILDATANIPPTLNKNQGDHIQVMVARDLDFSGVYALRGGE